VNESKGFSGRLFNSISEGSRIRGRQPELTGSLESELASPNESDDMSESNHLNASSRLFDSSESGRKLSSSESKALAKLDSELGTPSSTAVEIKLIFLAMGCEFLFVPRLA